MCIHVKQCAEGDKVENNERKKNNIVIYEYIEMRDVTRAFSVMWKSDRNSLAIVSLIQTFTFTYKDSLAHVIHSKKLKTWTT